MFSKDNGQQWHSLAESSEYIYRTSFDSKVIFMKYDFLNNQMKQNFYIKDLLDTDAKLVEMNVPKVLKTINDGTEYELDLSFLSVKESKSFLLANAEYYKFVDEKSIEKETYLISFDDGLNWDFIDLKVNDQKFAAVYTKDDNYYVFTESATDDSDSDSDTGAEDETALEEQMLSILSKSKVFMYKLNKTQFMGDKSTLVADKVWDKARMGTGHEGYPEPFDMYYINGDSVKLGFFKVHQ